MWDDDEILAVRYRGDFTNAKEVTVRQRIGENEILHLSMPIEPDSHVRLGNEVIQIISAANVRKLPSAEIALTLTADESGPSKRTIGAYTLMHEGSLSR